MPRDVYYLGVIVVMIGFNMALLDHYTRPIDCSIAAEASRMIGETRGIRDTLKGFAR